MATKPVEQNVSYNDTLNAKWTVNTGDDGAPITSVGPKTSVQVVGTFGGSTVAIQGSNDGTNWITLDDEAAPASPCSFTAAGFKGVLQFAKYIKPVVTGGSASGLIINIINK